jgi:hypothetical protein
MIFGLRTIKSVLSLIGSLKLETTGIIGEVFIIYTMTNTIIPKHANEDMLLFNSIFDDLFHGRELEGSNNG